jgi:hypothetical protein
MRREKDITKKRLVVVLLSVLAWWSVVGKINNEGEK